MHLNQENSTSIMKIGSLNFWTVCPSHSPEWCWVTPDLCSSHDERPSLPSPTHEPDVSSFATHQRLFFNFINHIRWPFQGEDHYCSSGRECDWGSPAFGIVLGLLGKQAPSRAQVS
eukprot:1161852-Pelagomonas_calceolata.AAC.4